MVGAGSSQCRLAGCAAAAAILGVLLSAPVVGQEIERSAQRPSMALGAADTVSRIAGMPDDPNTRLLGPLVSEDCGISAEPIYTGEVFTNARGGISTRNATKYQALLDLPLTVEFEKAGLPLAGRFFMLGQNTHGQGLTEEFIGDTQVISNIDSGRNVMQVSEYWWEFDLLDDCLSVRLGKQDVNTEFLVMDLASDFIHSSFGLSPSAGFPSYPNPSMAALLFAQLQESLRVKVGVWDALADGRTWGFSGNDINYVFGEVEYKYSLMDGRLPGGLDVGVGYVSGGEANGTQYPSGSGCYLQIEQLVYRENPCEEDDAQGLGVFASYFPRFSGGEFPITAIWSDLVAGVVYEGPLCGRDDDAMGAGVSWAKLNESGTLQETAIELFYRVQVTPAMAVQPDVQYIVSPSGIYRDALAVGMRFQILL
jgi:porin